MTLSDISVWYSQGNRATEEEASWVLEGKYKEQAAFIAERMKSLGLKTVLDLGCGSGLFAAQLRRLVPGVEYVGVDSCPAFLEMARRRAPELEFVEANLRTWEEGEGHGPLADVVCCWTTMKHFGLHEWDGVLKHILSLGRHAAFNVQIMPRLDLDDGKEYHHVFVTRVHLDLAIAAGGHEVVDAVVTGEGEVAGEGRMEDLTVWTRRKE